MTEFSELGLAEPLLRAVSGEGYTHPTPIQQEVIPLMMAGRDVIGIAQTGTGKTAAFVLPLLHRIHAAKRKPQRYSCGALILTPTRELAQQIAENITAYSRYMRASVAVVVGGVKANKQIYALGKGVDIVVATPGRLLDLANSGAVQLNTCQCVVLDEADQMLDLGFMPSIRKILGKLPKPRQTLLLSATMPKQIRELAQQFLDNPAEVAVAAVSRPIERIKQSVMHVPAAEKNAVLANILAGPNPSRTIVFTRTKHGADRVTRYLQHAGLHAAAIHGNKSQAQREKTLNGFRTGQTPILVATDIAARGIDIDDVSHVINFDLPNVQESYVHRIGRTARAGRNGIAISLCDPAERKLLRSIERLIGNPLPVIGDTPEDDQPQKPRPNPRPKPRRKPGKPKATGKRPEPRKNRDKSKPEANSRNPAPLRTGRGKKAKAEATKSANGPLKRRPRSQNGGKSGKQTKAV